MKGMGTTIVPQLRQLVGMTQEKFAHAIGVTVSTVNRWEKGHTEVSELAINAIRLFAEVHDIKLESISIQEKHSAHVLVGKG